MSIPVFSQKELIQEILDCVEEISAVARQEGKKAGFCIGNTAKKTTSDYFFTPVRNTSLCVCGSIIIDQVALAEIIVKAIDGLVDYIFVDTEKKISPAFYGNHDVGNVERAVRKTARKSIVLTYKANDLTVDAVDCFLAHQFNHEERGIGGKEVAIVGAGNIGFKIALKLTERGAHVYMMRRNTKKLAIIIEALNLIKPNGTIAKIRGAKDLSRIISKVDIVIGLTPGTHDITARMIQKVKSRAVLVDVGKGSFSKEAVQEAHRRGIPVYRTSVAASFEGHLSMILNTEHHFKSNKLQRTTFGGFPVVPMGLVGQEGDFVVDDVFNLKKVYGIADGAGDFNRNQTAEQKVQLEQLKELIIRQSDKVVFHAG